MANTDYAYLQTVTSIGSTLLMDELDNNLKALFDWGLLNIGGWIDVKIPQSGVFGGTYHNLHLSSDPNYTTGRIWETVRKDWVWETGVSFGGRNPIHISGVYVNGVLKTTGDATYGHYYDYPYGRVVFNSGLPTGTAVTLNYSYRLVQTLIADDNTSWINEIQYGTLNAADSQWINSAAGSGSWAQGPNHRVQLPAIVIETVPRRNSLPFQIGDHSLRVNQDVLFHVLAENRTYRNRLVDIISLQQDRTIWLFDSNKIARSGVSPLDYRGMTIANPPTYLQLVNEDASGGYRYKRCFMKNFILSEVEAFSPYLHEGTVRGTLEVILGDGNL